MRANTAHRRVLAALLGMAVGAVLSLHLAAPASAASATTAPAQPGLAPAAAGFSKAGTFTFRSVRDTDATTQAQIICAWMVENPHHSTTGDITTTARVLCSAPMMRIGLGVALFREGLSAPASETIVNDTFVVVLTADTSAPCVPDTWVAAMAAALVPPLGFFPRLATVGAQSFFLPLSC